MSVSTRLRVLTDIERVIYSQQQKWEAEYRFMCKDGSVAYVSDRGYVIRDENGDALRMVGGMSDVTERRRFLTNLARQATLLDKSSDAIMVLDLERRITYWNQAAEAIYGWRQDQALGRRIDEVLGEDRTLLEAAAHCLEDIAATTAFAIGAMCLARSSVFRGVQGGLEGDVGRGTGWDVNCRLVLKVNPPVVDR